MSSNLNYSVIYQGAYPPPTLSAGVRRVRDLCRGLAEVASHVDLFVPQHFGPLQPPQETDFNVVAVGPIRSKPTMASRIGFWAQVATEVERRKPDLCIFYNTTLDSFRAMRSIKRTGITVGYELCDLMSSVQPTMKMKIFRGLTEKSMPRVSQFNLVITRHIQSWVKSVAPTTPSLVVPGLFDANSFNRNQRDGELFRTKHGISPSELMICYTGSWWKQKGLGTLVPAFKAANEKTSCRMRLVITGQYTGSDVEDDVTLLVNKLGMDDEVLLPGHLDDKDFTGLLSAADVVVSPSIDNTFNQAAFPTKVAEYAGMGNAILATAVGDIPLYFEDGKNAVLNDGSLHSMTEGLVRLANCPSLRERLGVAARTTAQTHFDFRRCGHRIDTEVQLLLQGKKCA